MDKHKRSVACWTLAAIGMMLAAAITAGLVSAAAKPAFTTYVGYGDILYVTTAFSAENEAEGCFSVAGWSQYSDVAIICSREDTAEDRYTMPAVGADGRFEGTVWLLDGPGRYSVSVAARPPGKTSYVIVCSFAMVNKDESPPLAPLEYVGYGTDIVISYPRGGSNRVVDELHVGGWSHYARVRAVVENTLTGASRTYYTITGPDGKFDLVIPLEAGYGPCEVKLASKQIDANTWRGAAVYRIIAEAPPVAMIEPAYQKGTILATGRFKIRGTAPDGEAVIVQAPGAQEAVHAIARGGTWEAWISPPAGKKLFTVDIGLAPAPGHAWIPTRSYTVATVERRPDPDPAEKWVIQSAYASIAGLAASITAGLSEPYDQVKAVHDWIARNIAYDAVGANTRRPGPTDAISTLTRKSSVCAGYANLLAALVKSVGYRSWVVVGTGDSGTSVELHAWNEVEVNGRLILVDSTWDSGTVDGWNFIRRYTTEHFDASPEAFALGHFGEQDFSR